MTSEPTQSEKTQGIVSLGTERPLEAVFGQPRKRIAQWEDGFQTGKDRTGGKSYSEPLRSVDKS